MSPFSFTDIPFFLPMIFFLPFLSFRHAFFFRFSLWFPERERERERESERAQVWSLNLLPKFSHHHTIITSHPITSSRPPPVIRHPPPTAGFLHSWPSKFSTLISFSKKILFTFSFLKIEHESAAFPLPLWYMFRTYVQLFPSPRYMEHDFYSLY